MKKFLVQIALAFPVWLMLGSVSFAMCIWFAPPSRNFAPARNMKTLISRNGQDVTFTVQPQFSGDATDFALVMPFPSKPTVVAAPNDIFKQLEDITNPEISFGGVQTLDLAVGIAESAGDRGITIIEERDVGDFSTVTLKADDETALLDWLNEQGYEITDDKKAIIANYVASGGYFAALKVNVEEATVDADGVLKGELNPISFTYKSDDSVLPLRLMAGDGSLITLTVYTLAKELTYIPGAEIQYSKKVTSTHIKDNPALEEYDAWQNWLVRNVVQFDPSAVTKDLTLQTTSDTLVVVPGEEAVIFNPEQLEAGTGVIVGTDGQVIYTEEKSDPEVVRPESSVLTTTMVVALATSNVILLILLIKRHNPAEVSKNV